MTITPVPADTKRAEYVKGLRELADVLESSPEVPLPFDGNCTAMTFSFLGGEDPRSEMAAVARAMPCRLDKHVTEHDSGTSYFHLRGSLHGLRVELVSFRDAVCERVVTGTREVTEWVKDPQLLKKVPEVEVTKVVEDIEWVCSPLLAQSSAGANPPAMQQLPAIEMNKDAA